MGVLTDLVATLGSNPYFSAGAGLMGMGTGMAGLRFAYRQGVTYARRNYLLTLEIPSKDKSYPWMMDWVAAKDLRTQQMSVDTTFVQYENGEISTKTKFVPAVGYHFLWYKGRFFRVERSREKNIVDFSTGNLWENLTLTTVGRDRQIFTDMVEEAKQMALQREEGTTVIYTSAGSDWRRFGFPRKRRPLSSVILGEGQRERILDDASSFLDRGRWYLERGIPHRRGYLLHGPPGCGKSSFVAALAAELKLNICVLNLNQKGLSDEVLTYLLNNAPQRSVILLEDLDAASITVPNQNPNHSLGRSGITFSGLLNALDGVAASEGGGRLLFMTTNHLESLHPTLIRPGRVDVKELFSFATPYQLERMFLKFFPTEKEKAKEFAQNAPSDKLSMAALQAFFMEHSEDAQDALDHVSVLRE